MRNTFLWFTFVVAGLITGHLYSKSAWATTAGMAFTRGHLGAPLAFNQLLAAPPWRNATPGRAVARDSYSSQIINRHSGLCLEPADFSTGAAILQQYCNYDDGQQWTPWALGGNNIVMYQNSGPYPDQWLDARGGAANGTPVTLWPYANITNEHWQPGKPDKDGTPPLLSRVSGTSNFCLDVPGGQTTPGLAVQIYVCNGTVSQEWVITAPIIEMQRHP